MKDVLKHIAIIQTGIFAPTGTPSEIIYLQSKHFDEAGTLTSKLHPSLKLNSKTEKHLLKHGDVLFAAKGSKNFATCYESNNGLCVASSTFLVIRIKEEFRDKLIPEFLMWFINHSNTQMLLKRRAKGTALPSISKALLQQLEISIPSIFRQQFILKIETLRRKELDIQKQIESIRDRYIQYSLTHALK